MKSDFVICISESTKNDLIKFFPIDVNKIRVIYNGVSDEYFPLRADSFALFCRILLIYYL